MNAMVWSVCVGGWGEGGAARAEKRAGCEGRPCRWQKNHSPKHTMLRPAPRTAGAAARRLAPAPPPPRRPRTPHDRRPAVVAALPDAAFSAATVAAVAAYAVVAGRPRGRLVREGDMR